MISVVIPSHREGAGLLGAIEAVAAEGGNDEIVVAAHDELPGVRRRAERCSRLFWVECPRACRGDQLARGAGVATGDVLLFLHADTRLPRGAKAAIRVALATPGTVGGGFRLAFDASHPALGLLARLSALPWTVSYLGDQGLFCRRSDYQAAGGFRPLPLFEDVDLVRRLARRGRMARLPLTATTSARRFVAAGAWRQLGLNAWLLLRYHAGDSPHRLARWYRD